MKSKKIKVGVIGAGRIGRLHTENIIRYVPEAEVSVLSDLIADGVREWAQKFNIEDITQDYREVINNPEIDVILVCSTTDTHAQIITEAAKMGKHIFCEKPIGLEIEKINQVIKIVESSGVKLQVGFQRRYDHNFKRIKDLIINNDIGKVYMIKITAWDPELPTISYVKGSGGLFLDMTIHDFDMARFLSGSNVNEIYAIGSAMINPAIGDAGDIDTAIMTLKFDNGIVGVINNCRKAPHGYDQRVEVLGSKSFAFISNDTHTTAVLGTDNGMVYEKPLYFFVERYKNAFIEEIIDFFNSVKNDKKPSVGPVDGLEPVLYGAAAQKSLEEGRPVKIEEIKELFK